MVYWMLTIEIYKTQPLNFERIADVTRGNGYGFKSPISCYYGHQLQVL